MTEDVEFEKEVKSEKKLEYSNEEEFKKISLQIENNQSDEEDDCEGYFLEPVSSNLNVAEKIAEANKKLLEEKNDDEENRPRKVHFSDELINFEPNYPDYDYAESTKNSIISEENDDFKLNHKEIIQKNYETINVKHEDQSICANKKSDSDLLKKNEEIQSEVSGNKFQEGPGHFINGNSKLILVLVTKDQYSGSEYMVGEEVVENLTLKERLEKAGKSLNKKLERPKSAKKLCEVSKISPNLNFSLEGKERKGCGTCKIKPESKEGKKDGKLCVEKVEIKRKVVKKINLDLEGLQKGCEIRKCCDKKTETSHSVKGNSGNDFRPKSGALRSCFVLKSELPNYNGFHSEYGLSAEQLEERNRKTLELKHQKQQNKLKERQEELKRRNENDEIFRKWLFSKRKRQNKNINNKPNKSVDTLTRSDSYILSHASYATNHNVPYSVNSSLVNKNYLMKKNRAVFINKLMNKVTPNLKRSFNIYLGVSL